MAMTMQAAVARAPHADLSLETVRLEEPQAGELLVRLVATGICHTDIAMLEGSMPVPFPILLGHEGAGVVERLGAGVEGFEIGDHVVLSFGSCGDCRRCDQGHPAYCDHYMGLNFRGSRPDGTTGITDAEGAPIGGFFFSQSSFGAYALTRVSNTIKVRKDAPLELLGPLGCGISTGAGAVLNVLKPEQQSTLAVFGAGSLGSAALMAAKYLGVERIVAVDRHRNRLELARELGATDVIDTSSQDLTAALDAIGGLDYAVDTTGVPALLEAAVASLHTMGTCIVLGGGTKTMSVPIRHMTPGRRLMGVVHGDCVPGDFIPALIDMYMNARFPIDRLVKYYPIEDINAAMADSTSGVTIKPIMRF